MLQQFRTISTIVTLFYLAIQTNGFLINPETQKENLYSLQKPQNQIDLSSIDKEGYFIYYDVNADNPGRITLLFQQPLSQRSWFGMGFNYLMHKSHMIIIQFSEKYIDLYEAYSENYSFPQPKQISSLTIQGYYEDADYRYILLDADYYPNDKNYISIAYGPTQTMEFHGRRKGRYIIPLQPGLAEDKNDEVIVLNIVYKLHTTWLYYGWGFLADLCIISVRYLKGWKYYLSLHSFFFFILNAFTVIIEFLLLYLNQPRIENISYLDIYLHFILGSVFLAVVIIQHLTGYFLKSYIEDTKIQLLIPRLQKIHKYVGYSLYVMGKLAIFTGKWSSTILKNSTKTRYQSMKDSLEYFTLILIVWLVIEILYRKGNIQTISYKILTRIMQKLKFENSMMITASQKTQLMSLINKQVTIHEIETQMPKLNYCIIGQKVYDLTGFLHPGGNYMLKLINGREVQRYLNGQQHMEGIQNSKDTINQPYKHPMSSILFLKEKYIGTIDYNNRSILSFQYNAEEDSSNGNQEQELVRKHSDEMEEIHQYIYGNRKQRLSMQILGQNEKGTPLMHDNYSFKVVKKDKFIFYFHNSSCTIRNTMKGIAWLGLHFCIYKKQDKNSKNRLYTTVLCMTEFNQRKREAIGNFLNNNNNVLNQQFSAETFTDKLPFVIKKYDLNGAFSKYLHENQEHVYKIEGPLGRGLEMSNSFNGDIAIIVNGTGILPFLDLFYYFLQRNAFLYSKKINKSKQFLEKFELAEEDFTYLEDTNIHLYGSFEHVRHFYGNEIIQDILKSEELLGIKKFHLTLRLRDASEYKQIHGDFTQQDNYFDKTFIDKISSNVLSDVERIYVSGSCDLTYSISEALRCSLHLRQKLFYI